MAITAGAALISHDSDLLSALKRGTIAAGICGTPATLEHLPDEVEWDEFVVKNGGAPRTVLIDVGHCERAIQVIRYLKDKYPATVVIAADVAPSRDSFRQATDAGAWGYLIPPFDLHALSTHLRACNDDLQLPDPGRNGSAPASAGANPKLTSFLPVQGGNGASTLALHAAVELSRQEGARVLLADFDFHSGTLAFRLRLKPRKTLADLLTIGDCESIDWNEFVCEKDGLAVLVSPSNAATITPAALSRIPHLIECATQRFTTVIADLPTPVFATSREILKKSGVVCLICTPEITSLHLARRRVMELRAAGISGDQLRLVVNRSGSWGALGTQDVEKLVGLPVNAAVPNDYAGMRDANWSGGLIKENSAAGVQMRLVAGLIGEAARVENVACSA